MGRSWWSRRRRPLGLGFAGPGLGQERCGGGAEEAEAEAEAEVVGRRMMRGKTTSASSCAAVCGTMTEGNDTWVQSSWKLPDGPSSSSAVFRSLLEKVGEKITSDTVAYCSIFRLLMVNIVIL